MESLGPESIGVNWKGAGSLATGLTVPPAAVLQTTAVYLAVELPAGAASRIEDPVPWAIVDCSLAVDSSPELDYVMAAAGPMAVAARPGNRKSEEKNLPVEHSPPAAHNLRDARILEGIRDRGSHSQAGKHTREGADASPVERDMANSSADSSPLGVADRSTRAASETVPLQSEVTESLRLSAFRGH